MTTTVDDIEDLEALLLGLEEDEKANASASFTAPEDNKPADVSDEELPDEELAALLDADEAAAKPEVKPTKPRAPRRNLKPLVTEEAPAGPVPDEPSSTLQGTSAETSDSTLEELVTKVIDLLTVIQTERPDLTEESINTIASPVLERIKATSSLKKIEDAIRKRIDAVPAPVIEKSEPDEELAGVIDDEPDNRPAVERASRAAKDQVLEALANTPEPTSRPELTQADLDKALAEANGSGEPTDEELDALLSSSGVEVTKPVIPAPTAAAAPAIATRPSKPVAAAAALRDFIDADQLKADLEFTTTNITFAMTRQAALFAHYSRLAADAQYQADRMKQQVELVEATLNQRIRDGLIAAAMKFTEKTIDNMVMQDTSYQEAASRANEAKAIAKMVDTAADSFRHRKDMLIQVGADLRLEKQGELRTKEHPGEAALRTLQGNKE